MMHFQRDNHFFSTIRLAATRLLQLLMLAILLAPNATKAVASSQFQNNDPQSQALALLENMRPEEKVGQLFLISFEGDQALPESRVYNLISNYHIGGVVLERDHNNFVEAPRTMEIALSLIRGLQEAESTSSQFSQVDPFSGEEFIPAYIPLFVGLSQDGDGFPYDQILSGFSPQPNPMTLGATWDPTLAKSAGELLGAELADLGINLLLGPSLDILDDPNPENSGSIGVQSFGGDPYWVSLMGQAYIEGIHSGSDNQVAVVAKHLPGFGSSDRPLDEEIPTIRKSLAELTQLELAPFFAVTEGGPNDASQTDALLLSHIRYQGFQGNIRATTRPVSFDPQAFSDLMALEPFANWRDNGGLIISDSLGTRAVRRNFDPSEQSFNGPTVALDAFLAGNDLLYLGNFSSNGEDDSYFAIIDTAQFFTQKYREDAAFAERVDQAVLRIIELKLKLYPTLNKGDVYPSLNMPPDFGQNTDLIFEIALEAATLLSPSSDQLAEILPTIPRIDERIVFLIDSFSVSQCDDCQPYPVVDTFIFEEAVERLYGPNSGSRISTGNVASFSFRELTVGLDTLPGVDNLLMSNLQSADWIVIGLLGKDNEREDSLAFQRLIAEQAELLLGKNIVVFSLNAPFFLDTTEVSKLTAYYALFGKNEVMADIAARLLFQEVSTPGASPISVDGIGYSLSEATSPDPLRLIPISVENLLISEGQASGEITATPEDVNEEAQIFTFEAGDRLEISLGPILDHNGNLVPDNTPVQVSIAISNEDSSLIRMQEAVTRSAHAKVSYSIESEGSLQISASAGDPPALSDILLFDVIGINVEGLALQATELAAASLAEEPRIAETNESIEVDLLLPTRLQLADWFLAILLTLFVTLIAFQAGSSMNNVRWGVRWSFSALIGGLLSTSYLALNFPGSEAVFESWGTWGIAGVTLMLSGLGWFFAWVWKQIKK